MKTKSTLIIFFFILFATGCQRSISGKVVNADTEKPIEGAVVLVEWTQTSGFGLKSTSAYEVVETLTDEEGKFRVHSVLNPFVSEPNVTIYQKGYIAWNSRLICPDYRNRTNVEWKNPTIRLKTFRNTDSYIDHVNFIDSASGLTSSAGKKIIFLKSFQWELEKASQENDEINRRKKDDQK